MKKLIRVFLFILILSVPAFSSGWQFGFTVPIGVSFSFYNVHFGPQASDNFKENYKKSNGVAGFDAGFVLNGGYAVTDGDIGAGLLLEFGYSHDSFGLSTSYKDADKDSKSVEYYTFENLSLGILPKFIYKNFEFGLGVGIKIPVYLTHSAEIFNNNVSTKTFSYYGVSDFDKIMKNSVTTYVKVTFDYAFSISDSASILLGAYIGTDFGLDLRGGASLDQVESRYLSSLDMGLQLGFRFGENRFEDF